MNQGVEFEVLLLDQLDALWSYALVLTRRGNEADDLLQESLTRAFERFRLFDHSLSFKAWMFTIMRHTYIDGLRKRNVRAFEERGEWLFGGSEPDLSAENPLCATPLDPEAILTRQESLERLREAIEHLPDDMREVVELRDVEGLSYREIAVIIKRPMGTVMSRLYRGRNLLRSSLVEQHEPPTSVESRRGL
jgi:RNA polymerase sigma-70 factor (ECF subfamily)